MLDTALEHYQAGRLAAAAQICRQMLQQQADDVGALHLLGLIAARHQQFEQAIALYQRVIALQPQHLEAYNNLGIVLMQLGRLPAAIACYRQALNVAPNRAEVRVNLGNALQVEGDLNGAIACYEQALATKPGLAAAHKNLAHVLRMQGRLAAAILHHQQAIALAAHDAEAHFGYAFTQLIGGNLRAGFAEYEWRWRLAYNPVRALAEPRWDGSPLAGRSLLLWAEQGFGDTLQFVRYVPQLAAQGQVIVECQPALRSLLETVPGISQVIAQGEPLPNFDLHAPLLSLPHLLNTSIETIPATVPYLHVNRAVKLPQGDRFKIGIAWAGDPKNPINKRRSCPLEQFLKLRSIPGVTLYSLQKDCATELPDDVIDLSDRLEDFAATAAIVAELDLVISIDTALAHLAGGMGRSVWVVLPFAPDWRWLLHRSDCPWYPTMRLFRQSVAGDWDSVFDSVQAALRQWVGALSIAPAHSALGQVLGIACPQWNHDSLNLTLQLQRHRSLKLISPPDLRTIANPLYRWQLGNLPLTPTADCPVLGWLNSDFSAPDSSAPVNIGLVCLQTAQLAPAAIDRARTYDLLVVPSRWNAEILKAHGIDQVAVVHRGLDPTLFHPAARSKLLRDRFVIFAGGAGYPGGEDLVRNAFAQFAARHPEALLLTAWPDSPAIASSLNLGAIDAATLGQVLQSVDVALALDRVSGDTNAVAMAAMACGVPILIGAHTGHLDLVSDRLAFVIPVQSIADRADWGEVSVADVVEGLEQVWRDRESARQKGLAAAAHLRNWTWEQQSLKLLGILQELIG